MPKGKYERTPEIKAKMRWTPERRQRMQEALRAAWTPERKENARLRPGEVHHNAGRVHSQESREKRRQWMLANAPNRGKAMPEATKAMLRESRVAQGTPQLTAHGITPEMEQEARSKGLRWCVGCKSFLGAGEFSENASGRCKPCNAAYILDYRAKNPAYARNVVLKKYGVTIEWFEAKLAEQGGVCAICGGTAQRKGAKHLSVDHHHGTGAPRGLLCMLCNSALGRVESIPGWADRALAYLAKY